jgi:hypothetical protein
LYAPVFMTVICAKPRVFIYHVFLELYVLAHEVAQLADIARAHFTPEVAVGVAVFGTRAPINRALQKLKHAEQHGLYHAECKRH